jgi:hypothetical protein
VYAHQQWCSSSSSSSTEIRNDVVISLAQHLLLLI